MVKLNEPKKVPETKKYKIAESSSSEEESEADGADKVMKEEASILIDTKPKQKYKYHEATLTTNAYFSQNAAADLRKEKNPLLSKGKQNVKK